MSKTELNELASSIGRECERLIEFVGGEKVNEMVGKCIQALEMVEVLINERDKLREEVGELQEKIAALENRKIMRDENQKAFEKVKKSFLSFLKWILVIFCWFFDKNDVFS